MAKVQLLKDESVWLGDYYVSHDNHVFYVPGRQPKPEYGIVAIMDVDEYPDPFDLNEVEKVRELLKERAYGTR